MGFSCVERLAGTYLVPCPSLAMPSWPAIEQMSGVGLTALAAPPDFLALGKLATIVQERYTHVLWIRLQIADADPGAMLVTLLGAAARLDAEASQRIAEVTTRRARRGEWRIAYQLLAGWLAAAAGPSAVLVLEGVEHLDAGSPTSLDLLVSAPVDWLRLYLAKLGETLLHSSWMVALMVVPILTAYGVVYKGGVLFALYAILAIVPMLILPAVLGCAVTLVLVNVFPARRTRDLLSIIALGAAGGVILLFRVIRPEQLARPEGFRNLLDFVKLIVTKEGSLNIDLADDIVAATLLCRDGETNRKA